MNHDDVVMKVLKSGQVTISSFHYHTGDPNVLKHKANVYVEEMSSTFEVNILKNLGDTAVLINPRPEELTVVV